MWAIVDFIILVPSQMKFLSSIFLRNSCTVILPPVSHRYNFQRSVRTYQVQWIHGGAKIILKIANFQKSMFILQKKIRSLFVSVEWMTKLWALHWRNIALSNYFLRHGQVTKRKVKTGRKVFFYYHTGLLIRID